MNVSKAHDVRVGRGSWNHEKYKLLTLRRETLNLRIKKDNNNKLLFNSPKLWDGLFSCNRQLQQYPSPFIMYAFRSYRESSRFCPPRIGTLSGQYQSERQDAMKQESMTSKFSVLEIHRGWGGLGTHLKYSSSDSGPPDLDSVNLGYSLGITPFLNPPCMIWRRLLMDRSLQNSASKDINP